MKVKSQKSVDPPNLEIFNLDKELFKELFDKELFEVLPNILRGIRRQFNFTQLELAEKLNVDVRTYRRWENAEGEPSAKSAFTLGVILGKTDFR